MRVFVVIVLALSCVGYAATLALESVGSEPVPGPSASPTERPKCGGHGAGLPDCGLSDACVADAEHSVEPSDDGREAHGSAVVHLCAVVRPSGD